MLTKEITYVDYDGNERKEKFYFNLTKTELIRLEHSMKGGLNEHIKKITAEEDSKEIIKLIEEIVSSSYGEKSADGKRFVKVVDGHSLGEDFLQTPAYDELFCELVTDDEKLAAFIKGVMPSESEIEKFASRTKQ